MPEVTRQAVTLIAAIGGSAIVAAISLIASSLWNRRVLNRTERAHAAADFLATTSAWWGALHKRDRVGVADPEGATGPRKSEEWLDADSAVNDARERSFEQQARLMILTTPKVVLAAEEYVALLNRHNRAAKGSTDEVSPAADERATVRNRFVAAARAELRAGDLDFGRISQLHKRRPTTTRPEPRKSGTPAA